ncbi:hypothetical protein WL1483_1544 [Aeromonas schubertii]|uniref:Uncharacterized protein n=1 Tax=Aeromonas schubertii TaxID=652 RepID=A0A0S2SGW9_9GAMM|nr:hypothetical protein WL1483_1544 [Aeromonas schubertii]
MKDKKCLLNPSQYTLLRITVMCKIGCIESRFALSLKPTNWHQPTQLIPAFHILRN